MLNLAQLSSLRSAYECCNSKCTMFPILEHRAAASSARWPPFPAPPPAAPFKKNELSNAMQTPEIGERLLRDDPV